MLVAMPQLKDPNFSRTVVLLCEHTDEGALGIVVNRPTPFNMEQVFQGQPLCGENFSDSPVHFGGPVQPEVGFLIYEGTTEYPGSILVKSGLWLGTSVNILTDISHGDGPERFMFMLGYAGWAPEQLEQEISGNDWLVVPADEEIIFSEEHSQKWERAIKSLGISPGSLSSSFGTA